jgi:hypothetical protein
MQKRQVCFLVDGLVYLKYNVHTFHEHTCYIYLVTYLMCCDYYISISWVLVLSICYVRLQYFQATFITDCIISSTCKRADHIVNTAYVSLRY